MDLRQSLRKKDNKLVLDFPIWMRIALGAISLFLLVPMAVYGSVSLVPFLIALVSGIGALYVEKWSFDTEKGEIVNETGLVFLSKTKTIPMSQVEGIKVQAPSPVAGKQARFKRLVLAMKEGESVVLDMQKRGEELTKKADLIASITGQKRLNDSL